MRAEDVQKQVSQHELFATLSREEVDELLEASGGVKEVPEGTILIEEGRPGDALLILLTGSCEVLKGYSRGREHSLGVTESVDVLGEMSLLLDQPRSATVRTKDDVRYITLTRDAFETMLAEKRSAAIHLLVKMARSVAARHRELLGQLVEMLETERTRKKGIDLSHIRSRFERPLRYHI